ncbi:hypothetical protein D3C85_1111030 [compost metagenome]
MLAQGVGDFMAHDRGELIVSELKTVDQPGVDKDLAARTTVGIELVALDQVHFPLPLGRVRTKVRRLGNQPVGNRPNTLGIAAGLVQHAFAARLTHSLCIGLGVHLVDLLRGQHAEHVLLALNAHSATTGGIDRLAASEQQACAQRIYSQCLVHRKTP